MEPRLNIFKVIQSLGLLSSNIFEIDLSIEVLNIDFGQRATKISEVKFRGKKNISWLARFDTVHQGPAVSADFFSISTFDL